MHRRLPTPYPRRKAILVMPLRRFVRLHRLLLLTQRQSSLLVTTRHLRKFLPLILGLSRPLEMALVVDLILLLARLYPLRPPPHRLPRERQKECPNHHPARARKTDGSSRPKRWKYRYANAGSTYSWISPCWWWRTKSDARARAPIYVAYKTLTFHCPWYSKRICRCRGSPRQRYVGAT